MSKPDEFKFDSRVRERFLRARVLTSAELQKHLDELPDLEGEYEVLSDTPQPAVAPPRSEVSEEPLVFDGIRRLQALSEAQTPPPAARYVPPAPPSSGLPAYREPESRPLGTPLRSALMESEISGVGAGAVSAALGAMAAEARGASVFGVPASISQPPPAPPPPSEDAVPPLTLRSEPSAQPAPASAATPPGAAIPAAATPASAATPPSAATPASAEPVPVAEAAADAADSDDVDADAGEDGEDDGDDGDELAGDGGSSSDSEEEPA